MDGTSVSPPLVAVGNRLYRTQAEASGLAPKDQQYSIQGELPTETAMDEDGACEGDLDLDNAPDIQEDGKGGWECLFEVDSALFPMLIGKGGANKKQVEEASGAQVIFPSRDRGPKAVRIKGRTRAAVAKACLRLRLGADSALQGRMLEYNFFLSLPLATPSSRQRFCDFREAALSDSPLADAGLNPAAFMAPEHLHLTLAMLKLYSDEARYRARQLLKSLQPQVRELTKGQPLKVHLRGLEIMNDDPSSIDVCFLQVHEVGDEQRLARLCDLLVQTFSSAGLLLPQDCRPVKLHATVINTRYAMRKDPGSKRQQFDGRFLLQKFGSLDLGVHTLSEVHISQRGSFDKDSGYYASLDRLAW